MNSANALLKLFEAIGQLGFDPELVTVEVDEREGDLYTSSDLVAVFHNFKEHPEISIKVRITDTYWRYPTVPCYFVNYSHKEGDFSACQGTPHLSRALFDLGNVFEAANNTLSRLGKLRVVE